MLNDTLAATLSKINNAEKAGKKEAIIRPYSKLIIKVLEILKNHHYVGDYELKEDVHGGYLKLNLIGQINKCNSIKPRFAVKNSKIETFEKRYLPAKDFGILIISTPQGLLTHQEAKDKKIGGRLVAFCY